jgi:hypothetical protein
MMHHDVLYTELLPTLGSRILPALFRRLEAVAQGKDTLLVELVANSIARVGDGEVGASAASLLDHDSPFVKRAALKVLARRPHAPATDRLWALHREILADRSRYARPFEPPVEASSDSFAALRECVKLNPGWLFTTISAADPARDPVHVLASLVSTVEDEKLWQQCKADLFAKVRPDQELSLAINVFRFRDAQYTEWLRERIDRPEHLIGPWVLRALARLDPDAAIAELPRLPLQYLSTTKRWCFSELQRRRPEPAKRYILELLRRPEPNLQSAMVYQRQEAEVDRETLAVLFELLERVLDVELAGACKDTSPPPYTVMSLLADMRYPHQLPEFAARKGSPVATKLTEWLLRRGPNEGEYARPDQGYAFTILERFGGDGFTRVVNRYLESENAITRREVLPKAARLPNAETKDLLKAITQRQELEQDLPINQSIAAHTLAVIGEYRQVIEAIVRWGLDTCAIDLTRQLPGSPLTDDEAAPALDCVREGKVTTGVILALGVAGRTEHTDMIRGVLRDNHPSSDAGYAALIAISALGDKAYDTVALIARYLSVPDNSKIAVKALCRIGSDEALDTLLTHIDSSFSDGLALSLLTDKRAAARVAPLIRRRLGALGGPEKTELLARLVLTVQDPNVLATVLDEGPTRSHLYEAAFAPEQQVYVIGSKPASVRALAKFDADAAFEAANSALLSSTARDREFYPSLLVQIDPYAAISSLLVVVQTEKHAAIRRAIGRALASLQPAPSMRLSNTLSDWLKDSDPRRRKAAAEVLGYIYQPGDRRITDVRPLLEDVNQEVVQAASRALDWSKSVDATWELARDLHQETDLPRKWVLLDALIGIADPGDGHREPPAWLRQTRLSLPPLWREYLDKRIAERRKKLLASDKDE